MSTPQPRKLYKFTMVKDIALLREIITSNPFAEPAKWKQILTNFNFYFVEDGKEATERGIMDRFGVLLAKFRKDELASVRASGSDEEVSEKNELVREANELKMEAEVSEKLKKECKKSHEKEDEEKAKFIRKRAMEGLASPDADDAQNAPKTKKKKPMAMEVLMEYLSEKNEKANKLREREIDLQHERAMMELRLKEKELGLRD